MNKGIKSSISVVVKATALLAISHLGFSMEEDLPDIDVRKYDLQVMQKSPTGQTYVLEDPGIAEPRVGRIILLRKNKEPQMALRVLKTYRDKKQIAAKRVRLYADITDLPINQTFETLEKVTDLAPRPPTPDELAELRELEAEVAMDSHGMDAAPDPAPPPDLVPSTFPATAPDLAAAPMPQAASTAGTAPDPMGAPNPVGAPDPVGAPAPDGAPGMEVAAAPAPESAPDPMGAPAPDELAPSPDSETLVNDLAGARTKSKFSSSSMEIYEDTPEILAYDQDLDGGTLPPPRGFDPEPMDDDDDDLRDSDITVQEVRPLDPFRNNLNAHFGYLRNNGADGGSRSFAAGGFRYGLRAGRLIFAKQPHIQDVMTLEGGLFMYKVLNFIEGANDSYTVMPLVGTLRYTLLFGESFGLFTYGGVAMNRIIASTNSRDEGTAALNSVLPAFGLGMLFQIGPQWEMRLDLGLDMIGAGLVLRF